MRRARSVIGLVNRYLVLAGRNCCAGRSWAGLDRSLARRSTEPERACRLHEEDEKPRGAAGPVPLRLDDLRN